MALLFNRKPFCRSTQSLHQDINNIVGYGQWKRSVKKLRDLMPILGIIQFLPTLHLIVGEE